MTHSWLCFVACPPGSVPEATRAIRIWTATASTFSWHVHQQPDSRLKAWLKSRNWNWSLWNYEQNWYSAVHILTNIQYWSIVYNVQNYSSTMCVCVCAMVYHPHQHSEFLKVPAFGLREQKRQASWGTHLRAPSTALLRSLGLASSETEDAQSFWVNGRAFLESDKSRIIWHVCFFGMDIFAFKHTINQRLDLQSFVDGVRGVLKSQIHCKIL